MKIYILVAAVCAAASAAKSNKDYTTPVAILKQIDKHNEDGSYSYGYEAADGTFKIETKYPNGEVYGKYGYVDDTGTLREVEYGASRRGFEPSGNDITVAPPTINSNRDQVRPLGPEEEDDGQYREDPADYYKNDPYVQPQQRPAPRYRPESAYRRPAPAYEPEYEPFEPEITRPAYRPQTSYRPQSYYKPQTSYKPQSYYRPEPEPYRPEPEPYRPEPAYRPQPVQPQSNYGFQDTNWNTNPAPKWNNDPLWNANPGWNNARPNGPSWSGHPAQNVDIWTGSYSVNYKR